MQLEIFPPNFKPCMKTLCSAWTNANEWLSNHTKYYVLHIAWKYVKGFSKIAKAKPSPAMAFAWQNLSCNIRNAWQILRKLFWIIVWYKTPQNALYGTIITLLPESGTLLMGQLSDQPTSFKLFMIYIMYFLHHFEMSGLGLETQHPCYVLTLEKASFLLFALYNHSTTQVHAVICMFLWEPHPQHQFIRW